MRWIALIMMLAAVQLGCKKLSLGRSGKDTQPQSQPAKAEPEKRPLSELAPQPTGPQPVEPAAKEPLPEVSAPTKQPPPKAAPAAGTTYKIVKGDTYWSIAQRVYGDGKLWPKIQQANPGVDMNSLKVGQVIKIPPK